MTQPPISDWPTIVGVCLTLALNLITLSLNLIVLAKIRRATARCQALKLELEKLIR